MEMFFINSRKMYNIIIILLNIIEIIYNLFITLTFLVAYYIKILFKKYNFLFIKKKKISFSSFFIFYTQRIKY